MMVFEPFARCELGARGLRMQGWVGGVVVAVLDERHVSPSPAHIWLSVPLRPVAESQEAVCTYVFSCAQVGC